MSEKEEIRRVFEALLESTVLRIRIPSARLERIRSPYMGTAYKQRVRYPSFPRNLCYPIHVSTKLSVFTLPSEYS